MGGLDGLGGSNFNFTWGLVHLLAVCFVLEGCSSVRVTVLRPRADEHVFASRTDGFGMNILVEGMGRTPQNCGEWRLSIYEGERELSVQSLCTCFGDDQAFMNSCSLNVYFHHPQSGHTSYNLPTFDLSIVDRDGRELANTTHRFLILARNDTMLRKRIAEIETQYRDKVPGGGGVDVAIAIDELQWVSRLFRHERKVFSQGGEDGVLEEVFRRFGVTNKVAVEFGSEDGREVNSRRLWELEGWRAILLDGGFENTSLHANATLHRHFVTRENIVEILRLRQAPRRPDLLTIDVDYNDFWILARLLCHYQPRVVVAEVNRNWGPGHAFTVPYNASLWWTGSYAYGFPHGTLYHGMSVAALDVLAKAHGYTLLYVCANSVNALLLRQDLLTPHTIQHLTLDLVFPAESPGLHALYPGQRPWYEVKPWHGTELVDGLQEHGAEHLQPIRHGTELLQPIHAESGTQGLEHPEPRQPLDHAESMQERPQSMQERPNVELPQSMPELPHAQHLKPPLLRASQGAADGWMVLDSCANEPTNEEGEEEEEGWCGVAGCGGVTVRRGGARPRAMLMLREMCVETSDAPESAWVVDRDWPYRLFGIQRPHPKANCHSTSSPHAKANSHSTSSPPHSSPPHSVSAASASSTSCFAAECPPSSSSFPCSSSCPSALHLWRKRREDQAALFKRP